MNDRVLFRVAYCTGWLALFLVVLALAVYSRTEGDVVALAGAVGMYLSGLLAFGWYGLLNVRRLRVKPQDWRDEDWGLIQQWQREIRWFLNTTCFVMPGGWIGVTAHSRLLGAALYMMFFVGFRWLAYRADLILEQEHAAASPLTNENYYLDAALVLVGTLLGAYLRAVRGS